MTKLSSPSSCATPKRLTFGAGGEDGAPLSAGLFLLPSSSFCSESTLSGCTCHSAGALKSPKFNNLRAFYVESDSGLRFCPDAKQLSFSSGLFLLPSSPFCSVCFRLFLPSSSHLLRLFLLPSSLSSAPTLSHPLWRIPEHVRRSFQNQVTYIKSTQILSTTALLRKWNDLACFYHLAQKQGKALYKSRLISNRSRTVETVLHRYSFCLAGIFS